MRRSTYFGYGLYLGELVIGTVMALHLALSRDDLWPYLLAGACFLLFTAASTYLAMRAAFEDRWYSSEPEPPLDP